MDAKTIRDLKLFFSRSFVTDIRGGVAMCFREKGIKFNEGGAILTDRTIYNELSVGDWCFVPDGRDFDRFNYPTKIEEMVEGMETKMGGKNREMIMKTPRIILAFFEMEGSIIGLKRRVRVRRIFCATGIIKTAFEERAWGRVSDPARITIEGSPINPIKIDTLYEDRRRYAKLFQADLLKQIEKEDLSGLDYTI